MMEIWHSRFAARRGLKVIAWIGMVLLLTVVADAQVPPPASEHAQVTEQPYNLPLCALCGSAAALDDAVRFPLMTVCPGGSGPSGGPHHSACQKLPANPYPVGIEVAASNDGTIEISLAKLDPPTKGSVAHATLIASKVLDLSKAKGLKRDPLLATLSSAPLTRSLVALLPVSSEGMFEKNFCATTLAAAVTAVSLEACAQNSKSPFCQSSDTASRSGLATTASQASNSSSLSCPVAEMRSLCDTAQVSDATEVAASTARALQSQTRDRTWGDFWQSFYYEYASCGLVTWDERTGKRHWAWNPAPGTAKGWCVVQDYYISPGSFHVCRKEVVNNCVLGECCEGADKNKREDRVCEGDQPDSNKLGIAQPVKCQPCIKNRRY